MTTVEIDTPRGLARVRLHAGVDGAAVLVLGHGAGGGVDAPDLRAASDAAGAVGLGVALVEQPYRVAGRRSPPPAGHLDEAWLAVIAHLREGALGAAPLVFGGRSSGARVACRTALAGGAHGVLCLAFPLVPPRRASSTKPASSRLPELEAAGVPVLVVQGHGDRFGIPPDGPGRTVVPVNGDHSLRSDLAAVRTAVGAWLGELGLSRGAIRPR